MVGDRAQHLLNVELDNRLGTTERGELDSLLASQPELRQQRDALKRLADCLHQVSDIDPPAGLTEQVLHGIHLPSPKQIHWGIPEWLLNPMAVPFAAFAAGLMVAVGVYWSLPDTMTTADSANMVGSMVRDQTRANVLPHATLSLALDAISGAVTLGSSSADTRVLEFNLKSVDPVDIVVDLADSGLEFGGFVQQQSGVGLVASSGASLRLRSQGAHYFAVFLRAPPAAKPTGTEIGLEFLGQSESLYTGSIRVP